MTTHTVTRARHGCTRGGVAILLLGLSLAAVSSSAWSQSIDYGPLATAIPSLGGVALVLLSAMMFVALWQMKKRGMIDGSRFMALALVSGALASGLSGVKLVADARALQGGAAPVSLDLEGGGTVQLQEGLNCARNVTSVVQQIRAINADTDPWIGNNGGDCATQTNTSNAGFAPECTVGMTLDTNYACHIYVNTNIVNAGNGGLQESDLRLKADIVRVGTAGNGLPLYEYRYLGGDTRYRGVMAQDVLRHTPEAVVTMDSGYLAVRYDMLGLEMSVVY